MKWMLIVLIAGAPVKTDLLYNTLAECTVADDGMRQAYASDFNTWVERAKSDPKKYNYPASVNDFIKNKIHSGVYIPHAPIK